MGRINTIIDLDVTDSTNCDVEMLCNFYGIPSVLLGVGDSHNNNCISGYYLQAQGWNRKASTYTKGSNVVTYDGCKWFLNGKQIFTINDIP